MALPVSAGPSGPIVARILLEIEAVHLRPDQPFTLTSGRASPVYIDCRKIISFPRARRKVIELAAELVEREIGFESLDAVAGGETAGIPYAAWLSDRLSLPMLYVRKKPKGFGRGAQIEGDLPVGARCLVMEDLATAGGSLATFVDAVKQAEGKVEHALVIFHYGTFPQSTATLAERGVKLHGLATWRDVLDVAIETGRLDAKAQKSVIEFLEDPEAWSAAHGGKAEAKTA
jgi:orotate phosphoribosyltransferase